MGKQVVYDFYAELNDFEPKIYRRFRIQGTKTIADLGYAIMILFEMKAQYLFNITENQKEYALAELKKSFPDGNIDEFYENNKDLPQFQNTRYEVFEMQDLQSSFIEDNAVPVNATFFYISEIIKTVGMEYTLQYDYGDSWEVKFKLEKIEEQETPIKNLPQVIEAQGFGIVENIGGTPGLQEFIKVMKNKKSQEYKEFCEWLKIDSFDSTYCDIDDLNFRLKKLLKVYRDIYEEEIEPTPYQIKIFDRGYKK